MGTPHNPCLYLHKLHFVGASNTLTMPILFLTVCSWHWNAHSTTDMQNKELQAADITTLYSSTRMHTHCIRALVHTCTTFTQGVADSCHHPRRHTCRWCQPFRATWPIISATYPSEQGQVYMTHTHTTYTTHNTHTHTPLQAGTNHLKVEERLERMRELVHIAGPFWQGIYIFQWIGSFESNPPIFLTAIFSTYHCGISLAQTPKCTHKHRYSHVACTYTTHPYARAYTVIIVRV